MDLKLPPGWRIRRPETVAGIYSVVRFYLGDGGVRDTLVVDIEVVHDVVTSVVVTEPLRPEDEGVRRNHVLRGPFTTLDDAIRAGDAMVEELLRK